MMLLKIDLSFGDFFKNFYSSTLIFSSLPTRHLQCSLADKLNPRLAHNVCQRHAW